MKPDPEIIAMVLQLSGLRDTPAARSAIDFAYQFGSEARVPNHPYLIIDPETGRWDAEVDGATVPLALDLSEPLKEIADRRIAALGPARGNRPTLRLVR